MIVGSELCLVVLLVLPNIKRQNEGKEFFEEEGAKVFISNNCLNQSHLLLSKNDIHELLPYIFKRQP